MSNLMNKTVIIKINSDGSSDVATFKFKNIVQEGKKKLFSIVPRKIRDCPFSCSPFQINRAGSITFKWEIVKEMGDSERNKSRG